MPNSFFAFKQFTVHQEKCAMKVCTDACLFGAIMANYLEKQNVNRLADIGTVTGLLSLMVAQKNKCLIDAYEIDENAALQAEQNFNRSPWHGKLRIIKGNIKTLHINTNYDWIICNPPFYENSLRSNNQHKNIAMHSQELLLEDVLHICDECLNGQGKFAILLPYFRSTAFIGMAHQKKFFLEYKLDIKPSPKHHFFRTICIFSKQPTPLLTDDTLTIREVNNNYTTYFTELLKDYYLFL